MPSSYSAVPFSRYLLGLASTIVLLLSGITALNYVIDPYLIHQWESPLVNRLCPAFQNLTPWVKTYAVSRYQPEVVYLGNSRVDYGLPTQVEVFSGKRVFNLSLLAGSLVDAIEMLKHASFFSDGPRLWSGVSTMTFYFQKRF